MKKTFFRLCGRISALALCIAVGLPTLAGVEKSTEIWPGKMNLPSPDTITIVYTKYDFDGDGKKDKLTLLYNNFGKDGRIDDSCPGSCEITINDSKPLILQSEGFNGFYDTEVKFIQINREEKRIQIVLRDPHEGISSGLNILAYDGKKVYSMGRIYGSYSDARVMTVNGDGIVSLSITGHFLQSWELIRNYKLSNDKLSLMKEEIYTAYEPNQVEVIKPFKVYAGRDSKSKTSALKKGDTITLTATDEKEWVQYKDSKGKTGWIRLLPYTETGYYGNQYTAYHIDGTPKGHSEEVTNNPDDYLKGLQYYG